MFIFASDASQSNPERAAYIRGACKAAGVCAGSGRRRLGALGRRCAAPRSSRSAPPSRRAAHRACTGFSLDGGGVNVRHAAQTRPLHAPHVSPRIPDDGYDRRAAAPRSRATRIQRSKLAPSTQVFLLHGAALDTLFCAAATRTPKERATGRAVLYCTLSPSVLAKRQVPQSGASLLP